MSFSRKSGRGSGRPQRRRRRPRAVPSGTHWPPSERTGPSSATIAIFFVIGFPDKLMIPLEPIRLVDELGAGYGAAGMLLGTLPLAGAVLGYFVCSKLASKTDPFLLLLATAILSSTRFLGFALARVPAHLVPGSFLNGVANAGWDLLPLFAILLFADHRARPLHGPAQHADRAARIPGPRPRHLALPARLRIGNLSPAFAMERRGRPSWSSSGSSERRSGFSGRHSA